MMLFFPWSCHKNIPPNLGGQWSWNCYDKQILCFYQQNPLFISRFSTQMGINSTFWKRSNRWELVGNKKNVKTLGKLLLNVILIVKLNLFYHQLTPKIWRQIVAGFAWNVEFRFLFQDSGVSIPWKVHFLLLCFIT